MERKLIFYMMSYCRPNNLNVMHETLDREFKPSASYAHLLTCSDFPG